VVSETQIEIGDWTGRIEIQRLFVRESGGVGVAFLETELPPFELFLHIRADEKNDAIAAFQRRWCPVCLGALDGRR
jgi:hypothetical protein